jgi:hypothetical protein
MRCVDADGESGVGVAEGGHDGRRVPAERDEDRGECVPELVRRHTGKAAGAE